MPSSLAELVGSPILAALRTFAAGNPGAAAALPDADPLDLFDLMPAADAFYWEQAEHDLTFAALIPPDTEPDADLQLIAGDTPRLTPRRVGAFSFDGDRNGGDAWQGLPRSIWRDPAVVAARAGGATALAAAAGARSWLQQTLAAESNPAHVAAGTATADPSRDWWNASVGRALSAIESGGLDKLVLARRETVVLPAFNLRTTIERLRERYREATIFALRSAGAIFVGATPERLARVDGRIVETTALAGTARNTGEAAATALMSDEKERREHEHVVRSIGETLGPLCSELDLPSKPEFLSLNGIVHLATPISGRLANGANALDVARRLHPTPSVAGLPQREALALLAELEPFDRGWYAGPLGWMDENGDGEFVVGLRAALITPDAAPGHRAALYAGCGLVAGSDADREWEESLLKMEPMRWALASR